MRKCLLLLVLVWFSALPASAQQAPDYSIRSIRTPLSENEIVIQFEVLNNGGPAADATTASVSIATSEQTIASETVPPLAENEQATITISIPASAPGLTAGERVLFLIRVGIGDIEPEDSNTVGDNSAITPAVIVPGVAETQPTEPVEVESPAVPPTQPPPGPFRLPTLDLTNPLHIALIIGAAGILLILIWMLTVILRLLFAQPPAFTTWQPPYAYSPLLDPNSTAGRRQLWQQHAQSDALPAPCAVGSFMARKVLIGMKGQKLEGWHVTALRISQYDMYGRVARSQTLASAGVVKGLDRALRKAPGRAPERLASLLRPAVKRLFRDFARRLKRTPTLPVALDIRLKGTHGEVRIIFELYQCVDNQWHIIDQWEPEMTLLSGSLFENFTYSLTGQHSSETSRQFRQRLQNDITQMLTSMIQQPPPVVLPPPSSPGDTAPVKPINSDTAANS
jgi:hypothetical protein